MAENQFSVAVPNLLQAITLGEQGYKDQKLDNSRNQLQSLLSEGGPVDLQRAAIQQLSRGDIEGAKALSTLYGHQMGQNSVYGTPIYGTGPNGETQIGSFNKSGTFVPINTGGFTPTPGVKVLDTGTGFVPVNSKSGQPVQGGTYQPGQAPQGVPGSPAPQTGYIPKDVAGEAREKTYGKDVGERQAALGQAKSTLDNSVNGLDRLATQANEVMNHPGLSHATGFLGEYHIPGLSGADAQAKIDTLKSQVGFAVLQQMRDNSKTGGALGSVSDFENRTLQNNLAELQQAQSTAQFKAALKKIITYTEGAKDRLRNAYQQDYSNIPQPNPSQQPTTLTHPVQTQSFTRANPQGQPTGAPKPPSMGEVRDGYRYKGGNPADQSSWVQLR